MQKQCDACGESTDEEYTVDFFSRDKKDSIIVCEYCSKNEHSFSFDDVEYFEP